MFALQLLFWLACGVILYTYVGYPALLSLLTRLRSARVQQDAAIRSVSVILCAHNEEACIGRKITNLLAQDYPADQLQILIASDGSDDNTDAIIQSFQDPRLVFYRSSERVGKPTNIGRLAAMATGEILVFADARQMFRPDALRQLVAPFADPTVGCVSGSLQLEEGQNAISCGSGLYRKYEEWIREREGRYYSMLGAAGAIYAARRASFLAPAPDTILDDFVIPLHYLASGYRTVFAPDAVAVDHSPGSPKDEFTRKARTLAGNYQALSRLRKLWTPFQSPVAWQMISHKVLRLVCPLVLAGAFVTNGLLISASPFYQLLFVLQSMFYALACLPVLLPSGRVLRRLTGPPNAFLVMNAAAVVGFWRFLRGSQTATWTRVAASQRR